MESQKSINLLDHKDEDDPKFQTKKWYIFNDQNNGQYDESDASDSTIKFSTEILKPFICDYSDAYILVTGNISVGGGDQNTKAVLKDGHPFTRSDIQLNDEHLDTCDNLDLIMNMYNLIEYSDNYSDSTASLYHFKRQEQNYNNGNIVDLNTVDSSSIKYKSSLLGASTADGANRKWKNVQIIVSLKYISAFFRSCELLFINTKLYIELNWAKHSVIYDVAGDTAFQITKTELHVPIVTLKTDHSNKLNELLETGFERFVNWNEYETALQTVTQAQNNNNFEKFY